MIRPIATVFPLVSVPVAVMRCVPRGNETVMSFHRGRSNVGKPTQIVVQLKHDSYISAFAIARVSGSLCR
jgi:hypothetical protein